MPRIRRLNGHFVTYDMPSASPDPELERPGHMGSDQDVGWVIEWLDGHTRPSKTYPEGRCRWFSTPARPMDFEAAMREALHRRSLDDEPTYRLRNVYTGEVVMSLLFDLVAKQATTLLLVTHNEPLAARCDRRLQLRGGVLV